ncbi:MAG: peptidase [Candidatus Solibacter sp.]|nr:peptidase [Candidatus Solibacter sp.]
MHAKTAAVFSFGFAAGMAVLAIVLWSTGHIAGHQEVAIAATSVRPVAEPVPGPVPMPAAAPPEAVSLPVPDRLHAIEAAPAPAGSRIAMPLAGFDPNKLDSTFHQARSGHEHEALDIMSPRGTPVMAVAEGNVAKLFTSKQGGFTVYQFDNTQTWCYYYAHLDRYAPGLKEGVLLRKGEVLGYVGSTGDASPEAPHLHFAVFRLGPEKHWWQGTAVDPLPLLK